MLGNLLLGTAIYYSGLIWGNPPWTALSLWEAALVAIVTVFGMIRCFEAGGGDANSRFAADFNCLSFPIWLWTTVVVWSAFWALSWAWRKWLFSMASADGDFIQLLAHISGRMEWFLTMAAIVACQITFFVWMQRMILKVHIGRNGRDTLGGPAEGS